MILHFNSTVPAGLIPDPTSNDATLDDLDDFMTRAMRITSESDI